LWILLHKCLHLLDREFLILRYCQVLDLVGLEELLGASYELLQKAAKVSDMDK